MESFLQDNLLVVIVVIIVVLNIIGWGGVILRAVFRRMRHMSAWRDFAQRSGLQLDGGGMFKNATVSGSFKGRGVVLTMYHDSKGGTFNARHTRLNVAVENPHFKRFHLDRFGLLLRLLDRAVSRKRIATGDPAFDGQVTVYGDPPEMVTGVLGDVGLRRDLLVIRRNATVDLLASDNQLIYDALWLDLNVDYLMKVLNALCDLAAALEGWQPRPGAGIEIIQT